MTPWFCAITTKAKFSLAHRIHQAIRETGINFTTVILSRMNPFCTCHDISFSTTSRLNLAGRLMHILDSNGIKSFDFRDSMAFPGEALQFKHIINCQYIVSYIQYFCIIGCDAHYSHLQGRRDLTVFESMICSSYSWLSSYPVYLTPLFLCHWGLLCTFASLCFHTVRSPRELNAV